MENIESTYYDQQLPFSSYHPQRHLQDSYVYYSAPARYSAPFGYASSREEDASLWASSVADASTTDLAESQPRSMVMDNIALASSVSRPPSSRRTSYSDSQTPPDSTESMSQAGSSSFDDTGYTYSSSSCSSPQPITPPYPPMDSPAVKVEQDEQGGCFILDELSTMSYFTSSKRSSGRDHTHSSQNDLGSQQSSEVPLRATGVSDEMKEMMRCFRVDPFSLHSLSHVDIVLDDDEIEGRGRSRKPARGGSPPRAASWAGLEAKPLDEEPLIFEFQLRIDGSSEEEDTDTSDSSVRDSSVSSVEAKEEMQLRAFSPSFQLASEQNDTQEIVDMQSAQQTQWQEPSGSYQPMVSEDYSGQTVTTVQEYSAPTTTLVHPRPIAYSPPITLDASYPPVESRQNMSVSPELRPKWVEAPRRVDKSPMMSNVEHERPETKARRLHPATSHPYLRKSFQNLNMRHQAAMHTVLPHHPPAPVVEQPQVQPTYVDYQQQYTAPQYTETTAVIGHSYAQQQPAHYERENAYVMVQGSQWTQQEVTSDATRFAESDDRQSAPQNTATTTVVEEDMMSVHAMSPSPAMMEVSASFEFSSSAASHVSPWAWAGYHIHADGTGASATTTMVPARRTWPTTTAASSPSSSSLDGCVHIEPC
ncbi:hypothetical protein CVT24_011957 [Panaeolus cyanescens]|uniref:Uncharacterized protein n=1 Tax=Panaeolus cyanescens TaxID=181874 RepID=A0A409VID6_9AGAR|nr:hypothetical protein CVT24_011957 [Panaeolus cyanescens]